MKELIFTIDQIFDSSTQVGCLSQYECKRYHIPPYQRGYKWGSRENEPVAVLLEDLYEAFKSKEKEYYLQYITVKVKEIDNKEGKDKVKVLEVIDGQQRLAMLSILLSILALQNEEAGDKTDNKAKDKLDYAVRVNFFKDFIYNESVLKEMKDKNWNAFSKEGDNDKQDIYYLFKAVKKIDDFVNKLNNDFNAFGKYVLDNAKLIVNSVESHVESETVFKNMNSNKVALTEVDLIKALLITKIGRGDKAEDLNTPRKYFTEIQEIRSNLGRQWDEMTRWANTPEIYSFFFGVKGIEGLLKLQEEPKNTTETTEGHFPLFTFFDKKIKGDPDPTVTAQAIYNKLKSTQAILKDWFNDDKVYNAMGYYFYADNVGNADRRKFLLECLEKKTKVELDNYLVKKRREILEVNLKEDDIESLMYDNDNKKITSILLALSVFSTDNTDEVRFDFHQFKKNKWSLEHIFPQNPRSKGENKSEDLTEEQEKQVLSLLGTTKKVEDMTEEEKKNYDETLHKNSIHTLGNLCLLSPGDNSAASNKFFDGKRESILKRIQKGSFVPKHTFNVFSKMIPGLQVDNLKEWTKEDIKEHMEYVKNTIDKIQTT